MRMRVLLLVLALAVVALFSTSAFGQCSMCRTALAGSNNALFIRNFNIGVLVLLIPPVTIFCSIFFVLKRYQGESEVPGQGAQVETWKSEDSGKFD